jgi:FtsP/CotA-like multicopper oxidase with cupredoxin domain
MSGSSPESTEISGTVRQRSLNRKSDATQRAEAEETIVASEASQGTTQPPGSRPSRALFIVGLLSFLVLFAALLQRWPWAFSKTDFSSFTSNEESLDRPLHPAAQSNRVPTTIVHQWRVSAGYGSPDGVKKRVYLINDDFIGPTLEAQSGDTLSVEVINGLEDEGLAIHWHGLWMRGSNEYDGAVGMTQDPIPPGGNFTYQFSIADDQSGSFWYHAHNQEQRADGLFGALIIHPRANSAVAERYDEERILMINDWYHRSAASALAWYMRPNSMGMEPVPDSILINGIGTYDCSMAVPARPVECHQRASKPMMTFEVGRKYRLRVTNSGMLAGFTLNMTGAAITVLEVDGSTRVQPVTGKAIGVLYPGQRVDLLMQWKEPGEHSLEVSLDREGFRYPNPALVSDQAFRVLITDSSQSAVQEHPDIQESIDLQAVGSQDTVNLPSTADKTFVLYTTTLKLARLKNRPHGFINHTTWKPQSPPLINLSRSDYDDHQLVPFIPLHSPPLWVDIVLNNLDDDNHPFHLHGHSPYLVQSYASGARVGAWNPFETDVGPGGPLNLDNPIARDTFIVPKKGYIILRFRADNVGIWFFHCHVLWHLGSGMAMGFEVGVSDQ